MMTNILTIIWFLLVIFFLGKMSEDLLNLNYESKIYKKIIGTFSFGFPIFVILSYVLNWMKLLYWWIYIIIIIIMAYVAYHFTKKNKIKNKNVDFKFDWITSLVIILSLVIFFILLTGAFKYEYLENTDPWMHAEAARYIQQEKTSIKTVEQLDVFGRKYMDPYPPSYAMMMGLSAQISDDVSWTLKFINSMLVFFAGLLFYLFASKFLNSDIGGAVSAITIMYLPSFMSHFIWSQSLGMILLICSLYILSNYEKTKKWLLISTIILSSLALSQPSTTLIGFIMIGIYVIGLIIKKLIIKEKIKKIFSKYNFIIYAIIFSIIISIIIFYGPMTYKYGFSGMMSGMGFSMGLIDGTVNDTSGGIIYSLHDIVVAPLGSKIDQATGLGIAAAIVSLITILILLFNFKKSTKTEFFWIMMLWLIFTIIGIQSNALPYKLFPHRFWVFLSIPIALLIGKGIIIFLNSEKNKIIRTIVVLILLSSFYYTSVIPRYTVQTAIWPWDHQLRGQGSMDMYIWMKNNIGGKYVFNACGNEGKIIGMNMKTYVLDVELYKFREKIFNKTYDEMYSYLVDRNFDYLVFDSDCITDEESINNTNNKLRSINNNREFKLIKNSPSSFLFEMIKSR